METYNLMITNVSPVKPDSFNEINYYEDDDANDANPIKGYLTNEAPIKSIMKKLGGNLHEIILIESRKVREPLIRDGKDETFQNEVHKGDSSADVLKRRIIEEGFNGGNVVFHDIEIADEPSENSLAKTIDDLRSHLVEIIKGGKKVNIYIESNGGVRYVLTMLLSVIRSLEMIYKDQVHIMQITSMVFDSEKNTDPDKKKTCHIRDTKKIFDTAQISGLISEFVNYGRVSGIREYFKAEANENTNINDIIKEMERMADDIQLCRIDLMLEDFFGVDGSCDRIDEFCRKNKDDKTVFLMVISAINTELSKVFVDGCNRDNPMLNLPKMIQWCLDKSFIQQALTLCTETIPKYVFESNTVILNRTFKDWVEKNDHGEYEEYYDLMRNPSALKNMKNEPEINAIINNRIKEMNDKGLVTDELGLSVSDWEKSKFKIKKEGDRRDESDCVIDVDEAGVYDKVIELSKKYLGLFDDGLETDYKRMGDDYIRDDRIDLSEEDIIFFEDEKEFFLDSKVAVSNNFKSVPLKDVLLGNIRSDSLKTIRDVLIKAIPTIIGVIIDPDNEEESNTYSEEDPDACKEEGTNIFNDIIDKLCEKTSFAGIDPDKQKEYYGEKIVSQKFYVMDFIRSGKMGPIEKAEDIQRLFYIYSICKEQRNMANHANVQDDKKDIAMNISQTHDLIQMLLEVCESCKTGVN